MRYLWFPVGILGSLWRRVHRSSPRISRGPPGTGQTISLLVICWLILGLGQICFFLCRIPGYLTFHCRINGYLTLHCRITDILPNPNQFLSVRMIRLKILTYMKISSKIVFTKLLDSDDTWNILVGGAICSKQIGHSKTRSESLNRRWLEKRINKK